MGFSINFGMSAFAVPGAAVDHFLRLAGETELKTLLLLLRHPSEPVTAAHIAEFLRIPVESAEEALDFWVQADVLREEGAARTGFSFAAPSPVPSPAPVTPLSGAPVQSVPAQSAAPPAAPVSPEPPPDPAPSEPISTIGTQRSSKEIKLDPSEIASQIEGDPNLAALFTLAEKHLGRPLNHMEHRSLLWMQQYLNIPTEVILMLLEYCVSIGKYSISYAESIAIRWQTDGIVTLEQAEAEITRMTREQTFLSEIMRRFELRRSPTTKQRGFLERWQKAGYSLDLIGYAYEITVENIEKADFKYIDTILTSWTNEGVRDVNAARALRENKAGKRKTSAKNPPLTQIEIDEMNDYLSLVNRFKADYEDDKEDTE